MSINQPTDGDSTPLTGSPPSDTPECDALWEGGWNHTRLWELSKKLERERDAAIKARIDSAREWSDQVANANARVARMKRELRESNARAVDLERMVESLRGQLTKALESVAKAHS